MRPNSGEILLDLDSAADILYVIREGYNIDTLVNIDSERVPGFVKRIDPVSGECVGFMVHSFSLRFPTYVNCDREHLKVLMDISLKLTNEKPSIAQAA